MFTKKSKHHNEKAFEKTIFYAGESYANQFFIYIDKKLIPWDIYDPEPRNCGFVAYFGQTLQVVDRALPNRGLVFYVTMVEMKELPSYGENVFVLILGDEFYRIPDYVNKVGGIFKCYGTHQVREQISLYRPFLRLSYFKFLVLSQSIKNLGYRLAKKVRRRLKRLGTLLLAKQHITPIYDIPPGYFNSENLPIKPIHDRTCDVFFDGSIVQYVYPVWSLRYWSKTPKAHSREQMASNLQQFQANHPEFRVNLSVAVGFVGSKNAAQTTYSQDMMNTKICLAPRGTTLETYRLMEAMRYGCVIVAESLPSRWFYDGAPIVQIGNWQNLDRVLTKLLNDPELLQTLHEQTLAWWETKCSEKVVGRFIADQINAQRLKI